VTASLERRAELPTSEGLAPEQVQSQDGTSRLSTGLSLVTMLVLMAGLTRYAAAPLENPDTWFHLRIGEQLSGPWSLTHPGQLSSFGDVAWVPTQWSTEMLAARFEAWFGLPGVAWFFGALYLALALCVRAACRREAAALPATVATGACLLAASSAISARPQVVSLVLLAVVVAGWLSAGRGGRLPYHLVPLTWVWATAHGMWSTGVVVSAVCCAGLLLDRRRDGTVTKGLALRAASVPLLGLGAACLTPIGPRLLTSQLTVAHRATYISEWAPTSFREPAALVLAAMVAAVVVCYSLRPGVSWMRLLLLLLACGQAALVSRMVACSAVLVAPLLAAELHLLLRSHPGIRSPWPRAERPVVLGGAAVLLACLAAVVPHTAADPAGVPVAFDARLSALPAGSPVVVTDGVGSWLEWRHPELDPLVDGMFDAYPVEHLRQVADLLHVRPGWQRFVTRTGARTAVLLEGTSLGDAMVHQLGWRVVQHSAGYVLLTRPAGTDSSSTP